MLALCTPDRLAMFARGASTLGALLFQACPAVGVRSLRASAALLIPKRGKDQHRSKSCDKRATESIAESELSSEVSTLMTRLGRVRVS